MKERKIISSADWFDFETSLEKAFDDGWEVDHYQAAFNGEVTEYSAIASRGKKIEDTRLAKFEQRLETWMTNAEASVIKDDTDEVNRETFKTLRRVWELWCSL